MRLPEELFGEDARVPRGYDRRPWRKKQRIGYVNDNTVETSMDNMRVRPSGDEPSCQRAVTGVKRTTGQHPGGHHGCSQGRQTSMSSAPVQYPANNPDTVDDHDAL